jgi:NitT/TauT family transport system ATP-binding protein
MIEILGVTHNFANSEGASTRVVDDVTLDVPGGQFVSIVGPSGCGKTTLLNMVAGLLRPETGTVRFEGRDCDKPSKRVGYMFARDCLLPWRTALKNVEIGLELSGMSKHARRERAMHLLNMVGLEGFERHFPKALSQGMRQRVAIARTLAPSPAAFLLDEPFAALDAQTRMLLQAEFLQIWESLGTTVVLVTHDLVEAITLADRVIVMSSRPGRILLDLQVGLPRPRDVGEIRFEDEFIKLSEQVWEALRVQVTTL